MTKKKVKPGPDPDHLVIPGNWKTAVKKVLTKKRPLGGWPDPDNRSKAKAAKPKKRPQ